MMPFNSVGKHILQIYNYKFTIWGFGVLGFFNVFVTFSYVLLDAGAGGPYSPLKNIPRSHGVGIRGGNSNWGLRCLMGIVQENVFCENPVFLIPFAIA